MDLLSGYASSDGEEQVAAEHVQPRPAVVRLPDAASLFAAPGSFPASAGQPAAG